VLDVAGGSADDGANVQLWSTNGSAAQHFRVTLNADGTYSIVNAATGKSLDIACASGLDLDAAGAVADRGTNVQQYYGNGTKAQLWSFKDGGWCKAASHAALYIGNGRVIGANGEDSPSERPWWGIVEETSVGAQAYGRRVRYIRYRWF
jgi:hypothetical protein